MKFTKLVTKNLLSSIHGTMKANGLTIEKINGILYLYELGTIAYNTNNLNDLINFIKEEY